MRIIPLSVLFALTGCTFGPEGSSPDVSAPVGTTFETGLFVPGDAASERTALDLAFAHVQEDADLLASVDGLEPGRVTIDRFGGAHTRFQQTLDGVPILGAEAIVHLADDGSFAGYTPALLPSPRVSTVSHLSADQATDLAVLSVGGWHTVTGLPDADLVIVPDPRGAHLAWRVQIAQFEPGVEPAAPLVFVDAASGEEVRSYDNLKSAPLTSATHDTYDANNHTSYDFSDYLLAEDGDLVASAAHQNMGLSLSYFAVSHGRDSFDGYGALVNSAVHYGSDYVNAFWYSDGFYFGDGDGIRSDPLVSLDIVAHEFAHGVTDYTADLIYEGESGALSEATSDMFAAAVEATQPGATDQDIWWVGEDVWLEAPALRYMDNPAEAGDPDYYPDRLIGNVDNGYVHSNSGIANLWFYLLSEGGSHPSGKTSNEVTGIGIQMAAEIWYDALVHRMTRTTNFTAARAQTLAVAEHHGQDIVDSVAGAWDAVGVFPVTVTVLTEIGLRKLRPGKVFETSIDSVEDDAIRFELYANDGDTNLYVRFGAPPTLTDYDCRPDVYGPVETCTFEPAEEGIYYVMVTANSTVSGPTLTISSLHYGASCGGVGDSDGDGACDDVDPCPVDNPDDWDGDGVCDSDDPCPYDSPDDWDGDGVCNSDDLCPHDNPDDTDGDGVCNSYDPCPLIPNDQDTDGDGVPDCWDACPYVPGDGGNGCSDTCDYAATLDGGSDTYELGPRSTGTWLSADLDWAPASADLDLYLQYKSKGKWRTAASSRSGGFESIDYAVPSDRGGNSYRWQVRHRSGTPTYCLTDNL
jgi:vibriolysin